MGQVTYNVINNKTILASMLIFMQSALFGSVAPIGGQNAIMADLAALIRSYAVSSLDKASFATSGFLKPNLIFKMRKINDQKTGCNLTQEQINKLADELLIALRSGQQAQEKVKPIQQAKIVPEKYLQNKVRRAAQKVRIHRVKAGQIAANGRQVEQIQQVEFAHEQYLQDEAARDCAVQQAMPCQVEVDPIEVDIDIRQAEQYLQDEANAAVTNESTRNKPIKADKEENKKNAQWFEQRANEYQRKQEYSSYYKKGAVGAVFGLGVGFNVWKYLASKPHLVDEQKENISLIVSDKLETEELISTLPTKEKEEVGDVALNQQTLLPSNRGLGIATLGLALAGLAHWASSSPEQQQLANSLRDKDFAEVEKLLALSVQRGVKIDTSLAVEILQQAIEQKNITAEFLALISIASMMNVDEFKEFIMQYKIDINKVDTQGQSVLSRAIELNNLELVQKIVNAGAMVNQAEQEKIDALQNAVRKKWYQW